MSFYKFLIKNISYPLIARREGFWGLQTYLNFLEESQFWSAERISDYQIRRIRDLLIHAYKNTPYYRAIFDEAGFNPFKFAYIDEMQKIPPLTKDHLNSYLGKMIAGDMKKDEIHKDATGGSTGMRTEFYRDNSSLVFKKAVELRVNRWAGWDIGDKIAYYWPAVQDFAKRQSLKGRIKNWLGMRSLMLYSGKLNEEILSQHYSSLAAFKPVLMRVFPNPLSVLAAYIKETGKPRIPVKSIISVGEPLLESQRKLFGEVFGSKVYNCYVSRECGNMAAQCDPSKEELHINEEMIFLEFQEAENKINGPYKILVTDLVNYGMPFIRYQIEDLGVPVHDKCDCGRGLSLMKMEAGRISDFLISPLDGARVSGCSFLHHLIAEGPKVGQVQVVQDGIDHLTIKIVKDKSYSEDKLKHFDYIVKSVFKGAMQYDIRFVSEISHEPSGKYFFTKCLV